MALRHVIHSARLYGGTFVSWCSLRRDSARAAAQRLPLAGRMLTVEGEIPLQLIKEHSARAYKCEGADEFSVSGSRSSRGSGDISEVELKEL